MADDLNKGATILGRSLKDIEKYGEKGTAYLGKVVISSGEQPVLGRKVLVDLAKPHLILICGKRGGGKCVDGDTLITLADGSVKKIKDLETDDSEVLSLNEQYKIQPAKKDEFFKRTVQKMLHVKFRSGKEIKLTPEHPLLTIGGWKPVQELTVGSRIGTPRKLNVFGNGFLSEAQVKLLAYLIAEGHTRRYAVWFSNEEPSLIEDFRQAVENFDETLVVHTSAKNNHRVVHKLNAGKYVSGNTKRFPNKLKFWLKQLGIYGHKSFHKFIPKEVLTLPKSKLALFLNRLFTCDGTIYFDKNTETWRISYSSNSKKLISQVQHLLLRFGVLSHLREKYSKLNNKNFTTYEIELKGKNVETYLTEIGFFGKKELLQKQALPEVMAIKRNENIDTIPKEIWDYYKPESWAEIGQKMGYAHPKALRESQFYAPTRQKLLQIAKFDNNELIQQLADSDIFWDEIKEVRDLIGEFEVYDISVPEHHNFVANDIIIHNSYSMAVLIEEFARLDPVTRSRVAVIVIDMVGIFWSLKFPDKLHESELTDWDLKPQASPVNVFVPQGKLNFYKEKGIPVDGAFTLKASELSGIEWMALFKLTWKDAEGILITRVIEQLQEKLGTYYGLDEIIAAVRKDEDSDPLAKQALMNRLEAAKEWGLIEKSGTKIRDLSRPGSINIIDVSAYRQAIGMEGTKDIIVALLGKKLFEERMLFRKEEEAKIIRGEQRSSEMPIVWMMIDEAHMFMPKDEDNIALRILLEWIRVGRQPGLSLVLATQRPERLHPDAISQCDIFISHRMTAQDDIRAVSLLRPSYLHSDFDKLYQEMPREKGYAIVLDDNTEKLWLIKVRPRFSWDAGVTASAFLE